MQEKNMKIKIKGYEISVDCKKISSKKIIVHKELFSRMCKDGCPNYGRKLSCPPFSPNAIGLVKHHKYALVIRIKADTNQEKCRVIKNNYLRIKALNAVIKSLGIRFLKQKRDDDTIALSSGSCNACKPCNLKKGINQCKKPEKRLYSLESCGIDCEALSRTCFNESLGWYKNRTLPKSTCVLIALLAKTEEKANFLGKSAENFFNDYRTNGHDLSTTL